MILSFFRNDPSVEAGEALYAAAVAQARSVPLFTDFAVPDTVEGRFEMIALHVYLILRRLKGGPAVKKTSQKLFDAMFQNMDVSLRELGVGDLSVGKKIRKLAENFYGRAGAYEDGLKSDSPPGMLARALGRNVYENESEDAAQRLADYVQRTAAFIETQSPQRIAAGIVRFPSF